MPADDNCVVATRRGEEAGRKAGRSRRAVGHKTGAPVQCEIGIPDSHMDARNRESGAGRARDHYRTWGHVPASLGDLAYRVGDTRRVRGVGLKFAFLDCSRCLRRNATKSIVQAFNRAGSRLREAGLAGQRADAIRRAIQELCTANLRRECIAPTATDYVRIFTARAATNARVASDIADSHIMRILARALSGIVSVGEKAAAFVKDTYA